MTNEAFQRLERERSRLRDAPLADDDRDILEQFDSELVHRAATGDQQHENHLRRLRIIAEHRAAPVSDEHERFHDVALRAALEDGDAARKLNTWIERRTYNGAPIGGKTKTHYRTALRVFGRVMRDHGPTGDDVPPALKIVPGGDQRDRAEKGVTPRPGEIHWWDPHVIRIIEDGCLNWRDKAAIALAWDSGARPSELRSLTFGDIAEDRGFYRITVGGKDHPERDPLCVVASPYLRKWLKKAHPANDTEGGFDDDTPVWTALDENEALKKSGFEAICVRIRERIDVGKPLSFKWFRKSRASIVAMRPGMSQTKLENRFGWVRGSQVAAHYVARFNDETDADVAEGDGLPEGILDRETDEREDPAPVRCPNCREWTPRHRDDCLFCSAEIVVEQAEEANIEATLREEEELREKRQRFMRHVAEDSVDPDELDVALRFGEFLDGNDEAIDAAEKLRDALDGEA